MKRSLRSAGVTKTRDSSKGARLNAGPVRKTRKKVAAASNSGDSETMDSDQPAISTSQKHRNFLSEPMGDKDVTDIAGIDDDLGTRLKDKGFDKAYIIMGQFLVMERNKDTFVPWLKDTGGATDKQAEDCYHCMSEWCREFM